MEKERLFDLIYDGVCILGAASRRAIDCQVGEFAMSKDDYRVEEVRWVKCLNCKAEVPVSKEDFPDEWGPCELCGERNWEIQK